MVVDVAGLVLALEVVERAEQEVALLLQGGERVGVEPGRPGPSARRGVAGDRHDPTASPAFRRACSTRARSASLARAVPPPRQRTNA